MVSTMAYSVDLFFLLVSISAALAKKTEGANSGITNSHFNMLVSSVG